MKSGKIIWKKGDSTIEQDVPICECGGRVELKGSAGFHDEYSYFYQCKECKNLEIYDGVWSHNSEEDFAEMRWEKVKEILPAKE